MIKHYEKALVVASERFPEYVGKTGVVLGISEDDVRVYAYSVFFPGEYEGINFVAGEIVGTGEYMERSEIYDDNDRVHVQVNRGKGSLSE